MSTPILTMAWPKEGRVVENSNQPIDLTRQLVFAGLNLFLDESGDSGELQDSKSRLADIPVERLRAPDAFNDVAAGVIDIALIGADKYVEMTTDPAMQGQKPEILGALSFASCHISLMSKEDVEITSVYDLEGMRVATSYPNMLKKILDQNGVQAEIVKRAGSVERYVARGFVDAALDVVESGGTLLKNGLVDRVKLMDSNLIMIGKVGLTQPQRNVANEMLKILQPAQVEKPAQEPRVDYAFLLSLQGGQAYGYV